MNTAVTSLPVQPAATSLRPWMARVGAAIWTALEASGQLRARRHLLEFADRCEALQPDLARELRSAARQGPLA